MQRYIYRENLFQIAWNLNPTFMEIMNRNLTWKTCIYTFKNKGKVDQKNPLSVLPSLPNFGHEKQS